MEQFAVVDEQISCRPQNVYILNFDKKILSVLYSTENIKDDASKAAETVVDMHVLRISLITMNALKDTMLVSASNMTTREMVHSMLLLLLFVFVLLQSLTYSAYSSTHRDIIDKDDRSIRQNY